MPRLRSLLYIPGNSVKMLQKMTSLSINPDAFVPDLEDSVPLEQKVEARKMVAAFIDNEWNLFTSSKTRVPLLIPRVNHTDMMYDDLFAICSKSIHGINVGKVSTVDELKTICELLTQIESQKNLQPNSIKLIPSIETAMGLVQAYAIASGSQRNIALCFGGDDFANDIGFTRNTKDHIVEKELEYARNVIAIASKAANIPAIDTPNVNFKDLNNFKQESIAVKSMGFTGKFSIHPNQIDTLNNVFGISKEEFDLSKEIVDAWDKARLEGRGSTSVRGRMVDIPVYKRALNVVHEYTE
jgi:citrate lyase subunit beta/citryl-CoA lyase